MARRRLTLKRIDPWSVLKFGFVANLSLLAIALLGLAVVWFFVQQLELIDKVCEMAEDLAFEECGVNGGNLFRATFLLGLLGAVVQTGVWVFLAFLYNLIADLVGGLTFTYTEETGTVSSGSNDKQDRTATVASSMSSAPRAGTGSRTGSGAPPSKGGAATGDGTSSGNRTGQSPTTSPGRGSDERMFGSRRAPDPETTRRSSPPPPPGGPTSS